MSNINLEIIAQAIQNEVEAYEFYMFISKTFPSDLTQNAFEKLALEEQNHVNYLKALMTSPEDIASLEKEVAEASSPGIYTWERALKADTALAMSVFNIAMQMEKDSVVFYEKAKTMTDNPEELKLFDELIKWENVHLDQFTEQYEIHADEWKNQQGYGAI